MIYKKLSNSRDNIHTFIQETDLFSKINLPEVYFLRSILPLIKNPDRLAVRRVPVMGRPAENP